jgi:hypothetical protein
MCAVAILLCSAFRKDGYFVRPGCVQLGRARARVCVCEDCVVHKYNVIKLM